MYISNTNTSLCTLQACFMWLYNNVRVCACMRACQYTNTHVFWCAICFSRSSCSKRVRCKYLCTHVYMYVLFAYVNIYRRYMHMHIKKVCMFSCTLTYKNTHTHVVSNEWSDENNFHTHTHTKRIHNTNTHTDLDRVKE